MGIRVVQRAASKTIAKKPTPSNISESMNEKTMSDPSISPVADPLPPRASVDKPFLLSDGKVELEASLNKAVYNHGESVSVTVTVRNNSRKTVRRIKVFVVQFVDVCMFSNGKFKNIVAFINSKEEFPPVPWTSVTRTYVLHPAKGATKNWIALEDSFNKSGAVLASTVLCPSKNPEDRNVFAIYVSYYVKVKVTIGPMGGELSLKLPFTLIHSANDSEGGTYSTVAEPEPAPEKETPVVKDDGDFSHPNRMDVKVECHEPPSKSIINNIAPKKCRPRNAGVQDENEILKCDEDVNI